MQRKNSRAARAPFHRARVIGEDRVVPPTLNGLEGECVFVEKLNKKCVWNLFAKEEGKRPLIGERNENRDLFLTWKTPSPILC